MDIDVKVAQLLVSRVCHDLAGGVGALRAGAELLAEGETSSHLEALELISYSAEQTVRSLQFLRVAFGAGGGDGHVIALVQLKTLVVEHLGGKRLSFQWEGEDGVLPLDAAKLLLSLCLLASDALPRGGVIVTEIRDLGTHVGFAIRAQGEGACLITDVKAAISAKGNTDALSARTVHGYFAAVIAENMGANVEIETDIENEVRLAALLPQA